MIPIPDALVTRLRAASRVTVLTGAGISAESGIPTFRDKMTGLWSRYRAEDLATPEAFRRDPELVWNWYMWRRGLVSAASPNPGHLALARMEALLPEFLLVTQNVDGLHQRAGSQRVLELHGNIHRTKCSVEHTIVTEWPETESVPPCCPRCGSLLRPDVVWFGESLPSGVLTEATMAAMATDVFLSIGTSALVQPAASLIYRTMAAGGVTVEINPQLTSQSKEVSFHLAGPSGEIIPALVVAVWPQETNPLPT